MRIVFAFLFAILTIALVVVLNTTKALPAPLGKLLSPQNGLWQNGKNADGMLSGDLKLKGLKGEVNVYFDERLVPHVFAAEENDVYYVQGYLHAKFRLWQMEFQAFAASGDLSKLIGEKALDHDREFRRLGMVFAAEKALAVANQDPIIKAECDAYTAGVNAYIETLSESTLPVEYKLIGYKPEKWTNLKTSLFLKYMSYDLASAADDFEMTNARNFFSKEDFDLLFPKIQDSLDPIIPRSQPFLPQTVFPTAPASADSLYFQKTADAIAKQSQPDRENGSNNWAVAGSKTASGAPILCNDPHLGLNLPSLWYEMQISTPAFNAYGATFPGAPGVIIGFNDSCAFGFTNGGRDVRDYFEITFKDDSRNEYLYNGTYHETEWRIDTIGVKDAPDFIDSVAYVKLGEDLCPVMFDKNFNGMKHSGDKNYAVRWTAHDAGNELKVFNLLNHANNYDDYKEAAVFLLTPGQNIVFADKRGEIALRTQGNWPAKWAGQGDFVMPGVDSSYLWQGMIPQAEIPFQYNPERGFVSSANQKPVAENYPYYLGRSYPEFRGRTINRKLSEMQNITVDDMMKLQNDSYDGFAAMALPPLLAKVRAADLSAEEKSWYDTLLVWKYNSDPALNAPTVFDLFFNNFRDTVYGDEYANAPSTIKWPFESTLTEAMIRDTGYKFFDDVNTAVNESFADMATAAFKKTVANTLTWQEVNHLQWQHYNYVSVTHLARLPAFSRKDLYTSGSRNAINANHGTHGPSWRMIVSLTPETEAYGIYPGGQSGNPGSPYFDNFIDDWSAGKYYKLWVMKKEEASDKRIVGHLHFSAS